MLSHINVGTGEDITIARARARWSRRSWATRAASSYDASKPDGTPRKLMDVGRIKALGWAPRVGLEEGLALAYEDFQRSAGGHRQ